MSPTLQPRYFLPTTSALAVLALLAAPARAQDPAEPTLATVTVTGNPLGAEQPIAPVLRLEGGELLQRSQPTLGATLDGTPGISSTYFGPNASRPVIRGLDGDRIRILSNGSASQDVSALSYDHAVPLDPLLVERIEVLRGPATLQYGGSAVGGVVNVIDSRIHRQPLFDASGGASGRADLGLASGNRERGGAVLLDAGTERYTLHVDAMARRTDDVAVPVELACTRDGVTTTARRICNSASESRGGAVGGTLHFDRGYLGAALSTYASDYGTVAEDEVTIDMRSNRLALEGELRDLGGALRSVKMQLGRTDYRHTEFEGAAAGTRFESSGHTLDVQARHAPLGPVQGVVGVQLERSDFSADGDEAYAPYSRTRQHALYAYEELPTGWGRLSAGLRVESVRVESLGHPTITTFAPATRSFSPSSQALGALWNVAPEWQLTGNLSWNERAPKDYELFADGEHVATNAYEIGDPGLGLERSRNLDVGLGWKRGAHRAQVQLFQHRFGSYIALQASDLAATPPEYRYTQVRARFTGLEASGSIRLRDAADKLDLGLRADHVRADDLSNGEPLPRIAPLRLGAALQWQQAGWRARLGVDRVATQDRVPEAQLATDGYTLWNAALSYRTRSGGMPVTWYARLENLGDTLAYSATSILTQTVPGRAPLPGRSLRAGVQVVF